MDIWSPISNNKMLDYNSDTVQVVCSRNNNFPCSFKKRAQNLFESDYSNMQGLYFGGYGYAFKCIRYILVSFLVQTCKISLP